VRRKRLTRHSGQRPAVTATTDACRPVLTHSAGIYDAAPLGLLERPNGAAISDLTAATGWQAHSVRAALTCHRAPGRCHLRKRHRTRPDKSTGLPRPTERACRWSPAAV
jgi:hypothetical protein